MMLGKREIDTLNNHIVAESLDVSHVLALLFICPITLNIMTHMTRQGSASIVLREHTDYLSAAHISIFYWKLESLEINSEMKSLRGTPIIIPWHNNVPQHGGWDPLI